MGGCAMIILGIHKQFPGCNYVVNSASVWLACWWWKWGGGGVLDSGVESTSWTIWSPEARFYELVQYKIHRRCYQLDHKITFKNCPAHRKILHYCTRLINWVTIFCDQRPLSVVKFPQSSFNFKTCDSLYSWRKTQNGHIPNETIALILMNNVFKTLILKSIFVVKRWNCTLWSSCSVLATGHKVRGSHPAEDAGFLRVIKISSTTSFGGEVKPSVPCRRFTACKRTLQAWKDAQNSAAVFLSPMSVLLRY
jgi:hypothetical protein